ncbi:putative GTP-binding protein 6-like isoform X2 [Hibiscus syriacus]|uniref:GTP-binding protein 6-like isoform X2 n=1 Tax=Hibiscus syriacus TaxID=106335 RepID=A0A6A2XNC7_HIBSY|nr:putative GTP-binding protein 6-like isoform X2 [Hibiscus syriacus]
MSLCFCSLISPSPLIFEANFPWNLNLNRSSGPLSFSTLNSNGSIVARVAQRGYEVDSVSLQSPIIEAEGKEEVVDKHVNGVVVTKPVEDTPKPVRFRKKRDDDDDSDDESFEERFKLRNGKDVFEEKAFLVGVERKGEISDSFAIEESLKELAQLADTAGLMVVGSAYQKLASPNPRTYIGSGKVALAQMEYQLPRLTKMWTHLKRQAGGKVKGIGEKQIEVDKRIFRAQVGYTNAGKSTLLNHLTGANVLSEDRLFATLDPATRRVQMKNGSGFLLTDTVGFIQKLPTTLVAAFRATLEEISGSSLLVHELDISHPLAEQQIDAVEKVLAELNVSEIPKLMVWNKELCNAVQEKLKDSMVPVEALLSTIHQVGMVEKTEYTGNGMLVKAFVPLRLARLLTPMRQLCKS